MSEQEIAYYLALTPQEISAMLCQCSGIEEALELLEKIGRVRAWYIYWKGGGQDGSPSS